MFRMYKITFAQKRKLVEYLREKCNYNEKEIEQAVLGVERMSSDVKEKLMEFLVTGKISSFAVEGVTVMDLIEKSDMNPITAFLAMDYLRQKPKEAKYILTRKQEKLEIDDELVKELIEKI